MTEVQKEIARLPDEVARAVKMQPELERLAQALEFSDTELLAYAASVGAMTTRLREVIFRVEKLSAAIEKEISENAEGSARESLEASREILRENYKILAVCLATVTGLKEALGDLRLARLQEKTILQASSLDKGRV